MATQPLIVLFGDSLILDSIEASLADDLDFSLLRLRTAHAEVARRLQAVDPVLVIFDLDAPSLQSIIPFLRADPGVPLLGVDVNGDVAVSLTCAHHAVQNLIDLQGIIRTHFSADPRAPHLHQPQAAAGALSLASPA